MNPIRVMVVDDSVVVRKIVTDVLSADPDIEVVGTAVNGKIAVAKLDAAQARPGHHGHRDAGDERHRGGARHPRGQAAGAQPRPDHHVQHADRARRLGDPRRAVGRRQRLRHQAGQRRQRRPVDGERPRAADPEDQGAHRPPGHPGPGPRRRSRRPRRGRPRRAPAPARSPPSWSSAPPPAAPRRWPACSPSCRPRCPVPVLVVQHMPPGLHPPVRPAAGPAQRRCASSRPPTAARSLPGTVHLAPGDHHLVVRGAAARGLHTGLNQGPPENFCRPAVDPLFRSAVDRLRRRRPGRRPHRHGRRRPQRRRRDPRRRRHRVVQDQATSVVWGMPGAIARPASPTRSCPLDRIPEAITRHLAGVRPPVRPQPLAGGTR